MSATTETYAADCRGCDEGRAVSGLTRRTLLRGALATGAALTIGPNLGIRFASAATPSGSDTLVVLFLRGGFDGLSAIVPVTDPDYYTLRPTIGIPAASTLQLSSAFGLHPALAPLKPLWDSGLFGVVHAAGLTAPNRSHFSAMEEIERAAPGSSIRTGWLDRTLGLDPMTVAEAPFRATSLGSRSPRSLAGPEPDVSMAQLSDFALSGADTAPNRAKWATALRALHSDATASVAAPANTTLGALDAAAALAAQTYSPGATYPDTDLGRALRDAARIIKSDQQVAVVTVDVGDWDMHSGLGKVGSGWMHDKLTELGQVLAAFMQDLGGQADDVTLVTMSEFGRRTQENASAGVDHGWGNAMLMFGGGVKGGQVHGTWPGLSPDNLYDGDLRATTDYRSVLADILVNRCGATTTDAKAVFPGWTGSSLGLTTVRT
ncbi:MAG: DUF1501 domain-containing protein [Actinomycetota bacterium]|nr:DUF1501 domain-containing protein [Actinomycetota bacterium]